MEQHHPASPINAPIGVFDSGIGGLSILQELHRQLPAENLIYIADQAHVPYGSRTLEQVRSFSEAITHFFLEQNVKLIVVACNTASAAALHYLRQTFPELPFVGMEPAVKPAAEVTKSGVVGVLATPTTFQGALYASVVERFARGVSIVQDTCPGLVGQIEAGNINGDETRMILLRALEPMLQQNIDTVVLACTHYPFVKPLIAEIVGPNVRIIDPAPAIARQARRVLADRSLIKNFRLFGDVKIWTTGNLDDLQQILPRFWATTAQTAALRWLEGELVVASND